MEFTYKFIQYFLHGLVLAAPLFISLAVLIVLLGQIVGSRESWSRFDSFYWSFITATTVGYGDIRPTGKFSRIMSIMIAFIGLIFTGIMVALALNAASIAFAHSHGGTDAKTAIEKIR